MQTPLLTTVIDCPCARSLAVLSPRFYRYVLQHARHLGELIFTISVISVLNHVYAQALVACVASAPVTERAACSPLELVFARGTNEADLGLVGTPLSRSLSSLVPG